VFPTAWRSGQNLAFEVRVRPIVRTNDGRERDAFLHAIGPAGDEATAMARNAPSRSAVYSAWLNQQVAQDDAAELLHAELAGFRLTRVLRRTPSGADGRRKPLSISGPDALFKGQLRVGDGDAFARLVARGIGRHRAFGFGMLLLKPPC
jgi:CRISPR system Cascade subunit CasE